MVQQLKPEVRARMLAAAEEVFAEHGYAGATMAQIARRAGVATGNLYRYFENKDALFDAALDDAFAESFLDLLHRRVRSLVDAPKLTELDAQARAHEEDLLAFWVEHRLKVIILLSGAEGSRQEGFVERFVEALMRPTLDALRRDAPGERLAPAVRFTLRNVFDNTVRTLVAILRARRSEPAIREAFELFWSYQLGGLAELRKKVTHG